MLCNNMSQCVTLCNNMSQCVTLFMTVKEFVDLIQNHDDFKFNLFTKYHSFILTAARIVNSTQQDVTVCNTTYVLKTIYVTVFNTV